MRRRTALTAVLATAALLTGTAAAAPSAADRRRVVVGTDGYLFIAQDWTAPCQTAARATEAGRQMGRVATALRASGRGVTLLIAPDKSTVRTGNVVAGRVPDKACADRAKAALWAAAAQDADLLDLRRPLSAAGSRWQTYWRKDTHWTPTASGVYGKQLAKRLDPLLPSLLQDQTTTFRRTGDLARVLQQPDGETVQGLRLVNPGVSVRELARRDVGFVSMVRTTTATPAPFGRVVPGTTVFVGDSMDDVSVEQLAPLFAKAVFVWVLPNEPLGPVLAELQDADRVVVETVERFAANSRLQRSDAVPGLQGLRARNASLCPEPARPRTVRPGPGTVRAAQ